MGDDIFNSLLFSFNGFPALPIFIGDFLLTQLKEYFIIPVLLALILLAYHYLSKGMAGGFKQIAIRSVVSIVIVFSVLQFSMPMEDYIRDALGTVPQTVKVTEGSTQASTTEAVDLVVFKDVEHFAIIEAMSTFIRYSDVIANNLTRKIIYGTTDMAQITKVDSGGELRGFFPSLIYNIQTAKTQEAKTLSMQELEKTGLKTYAQELEKINNGTRTALQEYENSICKKGILINMFDTRNGDRLMGITANSIKIPNFINRDGCKTNHNFSSITQVVKSYSTVSPLKAISKFIKNDDKFINSTKDSKGNTYSLKDENKLKGEIYKEIANNWEEIVKKIDDKNIGNGKEYLKNLNNTIKGLYHPENEPIKVVETYLIKALEQENEKLKLALRQLANLNSDTLNKLLGNINSNNGDLKETINTLLTKLPEILPTIRNEIITTKTKTSIEKQVKEAASNIYIEDLGRALYNVGYCIVALSDFYRGADIIYANENYEGKGTKGYTTQNNVLKNLLTSTDINIRNLIGFNTSFTGEALQLFAKNLYPERKKIEHDDIEGIEEVDNGGVISIAASFMTSAETRYNSRMYLAEIANSLARQLAKDFGIHDVGNPYADRVLKYNELLNQKIMDIHQNALKEMGGENGLKRIKTMQGMFSVFNEMRPEGTFPLINYNSAITWQQLGVFYTVFKMTYETAVRDAYIMSQVGKKQESTINSIQKTSDSLSREEVNNNAVRVGTAVGILTSVGTLAQEAVKDEKNPDPSKEKHMLKAAGKSMLTMLKIMATVYMIMFFVNILLPTGVWFIALMNYYIEIALYLAIAPVAIILMIFQVYHGAVQKFINVLIMLLLYPSVLVALYFVVLFLDMMLPILIFSFIPFFNDGKGLAAMLNTGWSGGDSGSQMINFSAIMEKAVTASGAFEVVPQTISIVAMTLLTLLLGTYLIFMLFRANTILAQTIQGSGFNMMEGQGFGQEAERKLRMMGGGVGAGAMM